MWQPLLAERFGIHEKDMPDFSPNNLEKINELLEAEERARGKARRVQRRRGGRR